MNFAKEQSQIETHYSSFWDSQKYRASRLEKGPIEQLPEGFRVLVFPPENGRSMWTYATCGMSSTKDSEGIELHAFSKVESSALIEILTVVAHFNATQSPLGLGHTVNLGQGWVPGSTCSYGLISLPYLDGPRLENFQVAERPIRCLWLVPVTKEEVAYKKAQGLEALERKLERSKFNYLDFQRKSVA